MRTLLMHCVFADENLFIQWIWNLWAKLYTFLSHLFLQTPCASSLLLDNIYPLSAIIRDLITCLSNSEDLRRKEKKEWPSKEESCDEHLNKSSEWWELHLLSFKDQGWGTNRLWAMKGRVALLSYLHTDKCKKSVYGGAASYGEGVQGLHIYFCLSPLQSAQSIKTAHSIEWALAPSPVGACSHRGRPSFFI